MEYWYQASEEQLVQTNRVIAMKGQSSAMGMALAIVLVSLTMILGVWIFSSIQNAVVFDTTTATLVNESINFAANNTYYNFAFTGGSGYAQAISVQQVSNDSDIISSGNYTLTDSQIKLTRGDNVAVGTYDVSYTFMDQKYPSANTTFNQIGTTAFSGFQLGVVALIVIAAVAIIGILVSGMGKAQY